MGIFSVNVVAFAMIFAGLYQSRAPSAATRRADLAIWLANFVLIDGKMRTLFSMLFGASMLLVIDRAEASGQSRRAVHYSRMAGAACCSACSISIVIWHGDILTLYALTGMVAFAFRKRATKTMLRWAVGLMLASVLMFGGLSFGMQRTDVEAPSPRRDRRRGQAVERHGRLRHPRRPRPMRSRRASRRPVSIDRSRHMVSERGGEPFGTALAFVPTTLALMLFGMAGYRSGFLTGEWDDRRYRRIAGWTLGLGALGFAGARGVDRRVELLHPLAVLRASSRSASRSSWRWRSAMPRLSSSLSRRQGAIAQRFAAVGRAAFSNYLGTSILGALDLLRLTALACSAPCRAFEAWLVVPLFWLLMLAWSKPWLDRFHYGPLEWLWRSLARLEVQPLRKRAAGSPAAPRSGRSPGWRPCARTRPAARRGSAAGWSPCRTIRSSRSTACAARPRRRPVRRESCASRC